MINMKRNMKLIFVPDLLSLPSSRSHSFCFRLDMILRFLLVFLCLASALVQQQQQPHPHTGKVTPFKGGDPGVALDDKAKSILDAGEQYQTKLRSGQAGRGLVVQDVLAPIDIVWNTILDFDNYYKMVPKTVESETYKTEELPDGKKLVYVRMKVGFPFLRFQVYFKHVYDRANNSLTWTLDYSRKSDFDDSVGFWYVIPHPDRPEDWTRIYYSVQGSMFSWCPTFVVDFMSTRALTDATAWAKKFSELEYAKHTKSQAKQ